MLPRTKRALKLVERGDTAYKAALKTGVQQSTIHRAIARLNAPRCSECGHILKQAKQVKK